MGLAEHQLAHLEHPVVRAVFRVVGAFQRQRQAAARRTGATGAGHKTAVQVQAIVGRKADAAAIAGHRHTALAGNIQHRLGPGRVQARALADHHKHIAGTGNAGGEVDIAADADLAAIEDLAVHVAPMTHRRDRSRGDVDQRLFTHPDRAFMAGGNRLFPGRRRHIQAAQADAAAPGIQAAVDGQLADAAQVDALAGVDIDHRAPAHGQGGARQLCGGGIPGAGRQRQAGTATLGQHALGRVFLVERRCPALQCRGRLADTWRQRCLPAQTVDRRIHVHLGAVGDEQPLVAGDVVGREALVEEVAGQLQRVGSGCIGAVADLHLARLQRQGTATVDAITANLAVHGQRAPRPQGHIAAFAAAELAVHAQGGPGRHIHRTARRQVHVAGAAQRDLATVHIRHAVAAVGLQQHIIPTPGRVQLHTCGHIDMPAARQDHIADGIARIEVDLVENIARIDAAAMGREVGVEVDLGPEQRDIAAVRHVERAVDTDLLFGPNLDRAQPVAVELVTVEHHLALAIRWQRGGEVQAVGDFLRVAGDQHLVGSAGQRITQGAGGLVVDRRVPANDQLRALGHSLLRLLVTVEVDVRCLGLAIALEHIADHLAFEHRARRADYQLAGIAAHRVAALVTALLGDQWVVVVIGLAPAGTGVFIALVKPGIQKVARRVGQLIQAPVRALEPGLLDVTGLHVYGAARQVELRALLRYHFLAGEGQGTALGHPFAHRVALGAEVAADFQQAAGGVPTVRGVAVGPGRYKYQVAQVDPHVVVDQFAVVAVDRRIALLVALHVDLDVVGFHRHLDPHRAGHVNQRPIAHQAAPRGTDGDLPAGGQGDRAFVEIHGAAADDLDARLIAAVGHGAEVVEPPGGQVGGHAVEVDQAVALLAVQRGAGAAVQQDRGGAALAQGHTARGVGGGIEQVDRAASVHRGAGQGHAVLLHLVPGQGDVTGGGHDQPVVADLAGTAAGLEAGRHFIAARGGAVVAGGADALADVKTVTGGQGGLALGGDDGTGVVHFRPQQQGITARIRRSGRAVGLDQRTALHLDLARRIGEGRLRAGRIHVNTALGELLIGDIRSGGNEVAHVDLAGAAEHHAVTVHDHHRAGAVDLALDLARPSIGVVDAVEHGPTGLLLEIHRGVAPDVKGFPVEDRLVGGLLDGHRGLAAGLALGRALGVGPALREAVIHLQATFAEAIGNRRDLAERRLTPRRLRRLLRGNRRDAGVQGADGTRQLLVGPCLLVQRRNPRHLPGTDPRRRRRLSRAFLGKPTGTERRGRVGIAGHHQQGNRLGQGLEAQHGFWGFQVNR
ncbi:hypothetical protein [Pseudomonas sp. 22 E 5]|nr:hypothetical protein [Pseudomonas sp. 22 E 5]